MAHHRVEPTKGSAHKISIWIIGFVLIASAVSMFLLTQLPSENSSSTKSVGRSVAFSATPTPIVAPSESSSVEPSVTPELATRTEAPVQVIPDETAKANAIPLKAEPTYISIPDANISMSVSVLPHSSFKGQDLIPPNAPDAYWVNVFDRPGVDATDMTMIVAHACEGLAVCDSVDWQFSRLSDRSLVKQGTQVVVRTANGNVCYALDSAPVAYDKSTLYKQAAVYGSGPRPDKLVLISCYTADIYSQNVVAVASIKSCDG